MIFVLAVKIPSRSKLRCPPEQSQQFCLVFTHRGIMNIDWAVVFVIYSIVKI